MQSVESNLQSSNPSSADHLQTTHYLTQPFGGTGGAKERDGVVDLAEKRTVRRVTIS